MKKANLLYISRISSEREGYISRLPRKLKKTIKSKIIRSTGYVWKSSEIRIQSINKAQKKATGFTLGVH